MNRRGFLAACIATFAAPAIVRASSLMPVSTKLITLDDTAYLQGLIDGTARLGLPVTIPPGVYEISSTLVIRGMVDMFNCHIRYTQEVPEVLRFDESAHDCNIVDNSFTTKNYRDSLDISRLSYRLKAHADTTLANP